MKVVQNMNSEEDSYNCLSTEFDKKQYIKYKNSLKKRSIWTKPWLIRRTSVGIYKTPTDELI